VGSGTLQDLEVACPIFRSEDKAIGRSLKYPSELNLQLIVLDTDPAKSKAKMLKLYGDYNPDIVKVLQWDLQF